MGERAGFNNVARAYAVLELCPGATPNAIRAKYRWLIRKWHPDRWQGDPTNRAEAERRTREIIAAWQTLSALPESDTLLHGPHVSGADQESSYGRRLKREEIEDIIRATRSESAATVAFRFLRLMVPAYCALALLKPRRLPGLVYVGPTTLERFAAVVLVLMSIKTLIEIVRAER